jgi:guanylate kinase
MNFVLFGPSAGGKTTLKNELEAKGCMPIISYTTRPPRKGEVDGRDYHFISNTTFLQHAVKQSAELEYTGRPYLCNLAKIGEHHYGQHIPMDIIGKPDINTVMISDMKCILDYLYFAKTEHNHHLLWHTTPTIFVYTSAPDLKEQVLRQVKRCDSVKKIQVGIKEYQLLNSRVLPLIIDKINNKSDDGQLKLYSVTSKNDWNELFQSLTTP